MSASSRPRGAKQNGPGGSSAVSRAFPDVGGEMLDALFDNMPILLCVWDDPQQTFRFNRHFCQTLGWTEEDAAGGDFMARVYPDPAYRAEVTAYMKSLTPGFRDLRTTANNGTEVDIAWSNIRLSDDTLVGIGIDIRDRLRVEQVVREREAHLRRVLDNLFVFVGVLSPDGVLLQANEAPIRAAALSPEEVVGRPFWDCYWWSYSPHVQQQLRDAIQCVRTGEMVRYDVLVRMAGDSRMWIDFQLAPLQDDAGRITQIVASATDVTERRRVAQSLHDDLAQSLAVCRIFLSCVKDVPPEGKSRKNLDAAMRQLDAAGRFTRSLMSELVPPPAVDFGLGGVLRAFGQRLGDEHGLTVEVSADGLDALPHVDVRRLLFDGAREALTNAVKHAGARHVGVELTREYGQVTLTVTDDGRGFDPAALDTGPRHEGGFGLHSLRTRVESHGGTLAFTPTPGGGLTLTLRVPV